MEFGITVHLRVDRRKNLVRVERNSYTRDTLDPITTEFKIVREAIRNSFFFLFLSFTHKFDQKNSKQIAKVNEKRMNKFRKKKERKKEAMY